MFSSQPLNGTRSYRTHASYLGLLVAVALLHCACTGTHEQTETNPAPPAAQTQTTPAQTQTTQTTATPAPPATPTNAPPQTAEVNDKLARIFKDAVLLDATHATNFIVGDFNYDGSEDIAIVVKPAPAHLAEINDEVANWILEDPHRVAQSQPHAPVPASLPAPVKAQAGDTLLVIIHGYKAQGWRSPEAQQTYLLVNANGRTLRAEPLQHEQAALVAHRPVAPTLHGDIIRLDAAHNGGFLYWTGAKYAWLTASNQ
jgi:hypothetical protein